MNDKSGIVKISNIKKAAKLLRMNYLNETGRVKHSIFSKEARKVKLLLEANLFSSDDVESLFNEISYGKTNNQFPSDYTKQKNITFENREYSIIDYRESILILGIILESMDYKSEIEIIDENINFAYAFNSSYAIKENDDKDIEILESFNDGWCSFNEKNTWLKNSGKYSKVIKLDIKNAFRSININFLYEQLENNQVSNEQIKILKIFLNRIEPKGGIPLFFGQMLISRIIWTYLFEKIILDFIEKNKRLNIYLNLYVDDIYIFINEESEKEIISSFSKHINKYGLHLNDQKTSVFSIDELPNKELSRYKDDFEMDAWEIKENKIEILNRIIDIETSYIEERINAPWINLSIQKEEKYKSLALELNKQFYPNQTPFIFNKNIKIIYENFDLNKKFLELVQKYTSLFKEEATFINESDLYFYLCLIDVKNYIKNSNNIVDYKSLLISPLKENIRSSFQFIYSGDENLKWLYTQLRETKTPVYDGSVEEIGNNLINNSIFNFEEEWDKSLSGFFATQTHYYASDKATLLTSNRSALSWVYSAYINDSEPNDKDKEFDSFLKNNGNELSNLMKYRNNSPISHAPRKKSLNIIREIYFGEPYNINDAWNLLENKLKDKKEFLNEK